MRHAGATLRLILTLLLSVSTTSQATIIVPKGVSGDLGYSYTHTSSDSSDSSTSNILSARITSDAYLWQPWFTTLAGAVTFSQTQESTTSGRESSGNFITGNLNMAVLPLSLFPFTARYSVSDSRVDTSSANDNPLLSQSTARQFNRSQLQLTQGILGKRYRINLRYNQDEAESDLGEQYIQEGYGIDYSLRGIKQNLSAAALFGNQSNNQNSNESDNVTVTVNHNYYPSSTTTLDSQASHVQSNNSYLNSGLTSQVTNTIDQASTNLGWRSSSMPLRINGGLRVHQMDYLLDNGNSTAIQSEGFNSSVGASYQFTDRFSGSISGNYNETRSDDSETTSHGEAASLNYSSERYTLSEFDYGWHSGLSGSNQESGESSAQSVSLSLDHGANRSWRLKRRSTVRLSLNQSLQESYTESSGPTTPGESGNTRRLAHSINLGWSGSDNGGNSLAQLSLSDSRGIVGDEGSSQMANLQLSRSQVLSNRSSLNGNLTWQASHYIQQGSPDYGVGQSASASASYRFARPFTLQLVSFVSDLRFTSTQPAVGEETQEVFWDNRFNHEIGMMRSSLGLTMRDHLGSQTTVLMFTIKRVF
jgi:hypothetical protein